MGLRHDLLHAFVSLEEAYLRSVFLQAKFRVAQATVRLGELSKGRKKLEELREEQDGQLTSFSVDEFVYNWLTRSAIYGCF